MFNAYFKNAVTDKFLFPIREKIAEYIPDNSSVIDIGSGIGSLLFLLADKIKQGTGIDSDSSMIKFCKRKAQKQNIKNLDFKLLDANQLNSKEYDIATSTLTIHSLDSNYQISILRKMASISDKVIIADIIEPERIFTKLYLGFDEILAGHYNNFRKYIRNGGISYLINQVNLSIEKHAKTSNKLVDIWVCRSNS